MVLGIHASFCTTVVPVCILFPLVTVADVSSDLAGWQLDKLAENPKKKVEDVSSDSDSDEDIPFACLICRKHYTNPIVTRCGHYFCSSCAIKRFARTPKCAACGTPTGGIFNRADKIIEKMNKKRGANEAEDGEGDLKRESTRPEVEGLNEERVSELGDHENGSDKDDDAVDD